MNNINKKTDRQDTQLVPVPFALHLDWHCLHFAGFLHIYLAYIIQLRSTIQFISFPLTTQLSDLISIFFYYKVLLLCTRISLHFSFKRRERMNFVRHRKTSNLPIISLSSNSLSKIFFLCPLYATIKRNMYKQFN